MRIEEKKGQIVFSICCHKTSSYWFMHLTFIDYIGEKHYHST